MSFYGPGHKEFVMNLNIQFGFLKGWLKTNKEASAELDIPESQVALFRESNFKFIPALTTFLIAS